MTAKILKISSLDAFVKNLLKSRVVVGPTRKDGVTLYSTVSGADELVLEETNCTMGPKRFLFPQSETLVEFEGDVSCALPVGEAEKPRRTVIFAARPCDARSFEILDRLFVNEAYTDDYYKARREATSIVCLSCSRPRPTCFCTSVGGDPFDTSGCDLAMTRMGDLLLLEPVTAKGEELARGLEDADPSMPGRKEEERKRALGFLGGRLEIEGLFEKLKGMFEHPVWEAMTEKCMGCGVCTYLCPTCHCFDIQDEVTDDRGRRVRNWDSCMFPIFTYHGSGHQPRTRKHQRMRQRIMHKFNYYPENFGVIACVGCGRCITECPTNEDLRHNLKRLMELEITARG